MPCCCAYGCSNRTEMGYKLYSIPKGRNDLERRNLWLSQIKRKDFNPISGARLCEVHFDSGQFEKTHNKKLKPTAIPTIFNIDLIKNKRFTKLSKYRQVLKSKIKRINNAVNSKAQMFEHTYAESVMEIKEDSMCTKKKIGFNEIIKKEVDSIIGLEDGNNDKNIYLVEKTSKSIKEIRDMKKKMTTLKQKWLLLNRKHEYLEINLNQIFTTDQIEFLKSDFPRDIKWSNETVRRATQLRLTCGYAGYYLLLNSGFPLPRFLLTEPNVATNLFARDFIDSKGLNL